MSGPFTITIAHNTPEIQARIAKVPAAVGEQVGRALGTGAAQVSRTARAKAPKAESELTNAIQPERVTLLEWHVRAAKAYASMVEDGSGPGGQPSQGRMLAWIRRKGITPRTPGMTPRGLAQLMRRRIAQEGTSAQPYMRPALEENRSRLELLFRAAVAGGLASVEQGRAL